MGGDVFLHSKQKLKDTVRPSKKEILDTCLTYLTLLRGQYSDVFSVALNPKRI